MLCVTCFLFLSRFFHVFVFVIFFLFFFFFFSSRRRHTRLVSDWIRRVLFRSSRPTWRSPSLALSPAKPPRRDVAWATPERSSVAARAPPKTSTTRWPPPASAPSKRPRTSDRKSVV